MTPVEVVHIFGYNSFNVQAIISDCANFRYIRIRGLGVTKGEELSIIKRDFKVRINFATGGINTPSTWTDEMTEGLIYLLQNFDTCFEYLRKY